MYTIYSDDKVIVYSNLEKMIDLDVSKVINEGADTYVIRKIEGMNYMLFSSKLEIEGKIIWIINAYDITGVYTERDRQLSEILKTDIVILVVSLIIISICSIILTKSIKKLNLTSKKIASGEFDQRVNIKGKDEIGELADSFNEMANQVENRINELNLQVKKKDDFISGFTHELKTPMTAIVGYSDLLRLKKCDEDFSKKALNYIYSEAKRLEGLSHKLMKLMSLSEGKEELKAFRIKDLMNRVQKAEESILRGNKLEIDACDISVIGDMDLLEVVLRNLIENSAKAEPKDNKVLVKGESLDNSRYRISVIDRGKGIPKEHIDRVTESFYMVDKSRRYEERRSEAE